MKRVVLVLVCAVAAFHGLGAQQTIDDTRARCGAGQLTATRHAPLPTNVSQCWFIRDVPGASAGESRVNPAALARFAKGVRAVASEDFAAGLSLLNGLDLDTTPLAGYTRYYTGVALAGLARFAEADAVFTSMMTSRLTGFCAKPFPFASQEVAVARQDPARAEVDPARADRRGTRVAGGRVARARAGRGNAEPSRARARAVSPHLLRQPVERAGC